MSVLDRFMGWLLPDQERAITPQQLFGTGADEWLAGDTAAGVRMTTELAMQSAIGACVRLLADDISTLPFDVFRRDGRRKVEIEPPDWLKHPTGRLWDTPISHISDNIVSLGTDGNTFILAQPFAIPDDVAPETVRVLEPGEVVIEEEGQLGYRINGGRLLGEQEVIHIPWLRLPGSLRGLSPLAASRESSALEIAAREWAGRFFGKGATVGGVVQVPPGVKMSTEDIGELRKQFAMRHQGRRKSHIFGVLTGGATYQPVTLKPSEAELEPLWRQVLEAACRIYHIPTHLVASQDPGAAARSSVEERGIAYVRHAIRPFVKRIEPIYSALVPGTDTYVRFNLNALMQGDAKTRAEYYQVMLQSKVMRREEARDKEDLPYDGDLGYLETPNNNSDEAEPERSLSLSVHDAPITMAPELRIDSVQVSEQAADRIAEASTSGIAAGLVAISDRIAEGDGTVVEAVERVTASTLTLAERLEHVVAQQAELAERQRQAEEREAARNMPIEYHVEKDANGRTVGIIERRGASVIRKRVERDETGAVLSITAA